MSSLLRSCFVCRRTSLPFYLSAQHQLFSSSSTLLAVISGAPRWRAWRCAKRAATTFWQTPRPTRIFSATSFPERSRLDHCVTLFATVSCLGNHFVFVGHLPCVASRPDASAASLWSSQVPRRNRSNESVAWREWGLTSSEAAWVSNHAHNSGTCLFFFSFRHVCFRCCYSSTKCDSTDPWPLPRALDTGSFLLCRGLR